MSALASYTVESTQPALVPAPWQENAERTTEVIQGARRLLNYTAALRQLRHDAGELGDLTTDPQYFVAANAMRGRRVLAVLIFRLGQLEACVYFFEHCFYGLGLGLCRGGDGIGEGLVAGGSPAWRVHYVALAARALLGHWRIHGVSLAVLAPVERCLAVMGPADHDHRFASRSVARCFLLADTYRETLARLGPRTRRSLAGKRRKLEASRDLEFVPDLDPVEALQGMLSLRLKASPLRGADFYRARQALAEVRPEFFFMGLRLGSGPGPRHWLSLLSGWRLGDTTFVDLQLNHDDYKQASLSAVMRAYLLEHETQSQQRLISFVGGTSLLLRRYCSPAEPAAYVYLGRPSLRRFLFDKVAPLLKKDCVCARFADR